MRTPSTLAILSALFLQTAIAQEMPTMPSGETLQMIMDRERARSGSALDEAAAISQTPRRAPTVDMVRIEEMGGVDPLAIAKQYEEQRQEAPAEALYIFVSTSLPMDTLKLLGEQAVRGGAALVLRGVPGGLEGYAKIAQTLKPVIMTGADIQIHPELFERFEVKAVPAFVLAKHEEGCQGNLCDAESIAVSGDVSLPYALEHLSTRAHPLAGVAKDRLRRFR